MRLAEVKVPYPMPVAVSFDKRRVFMEWAVAQGYPKIKFRPMTHDSMQIVCYGPSLEDTWQEINPDEPLITMSGSLKFLLEKGLEPRPGKWFHAHVDPRTDNLQCVVRHKDVIYLIGSCSNPQIYKMLEGLKVAMWHGNSGAGTKEWIEQNDPGQILVCAGSTIGLSSIHLGGVFGFYHFEVFGMDGSYKNHERHAGLHGGIKHQERPSVLNPEYMTCRVMDNANVEVVSMLKSFPVFCVFHGDGVIQDWVGKNDLPNAARHGTPKADGVRQSKYYALTKEQALAMMKLKAA